MKRIIAIVISIFMFAPSFVYGEGGNGMAQYNNYQTGSMTDMNKVPGGVTYTNSSGKKKHWDAKTNMDYDAQLYDLKQALLKSQINALANSRDRALSNLNTEQSSLADIYYNKKNQAAGRSDIGALNFAQKMAAWNVQGNAGAMPEIYRNNALQGQIGALDQQEASDNAAIEAQKADINNAYTNDVTAAESNNQAELLQATLDKINADKLAALEQQKTDVADKAATEKTNYARLQDTKQDYTNNIGQFAANFLAEYNRVKNDGDLSNDWQLAPLMNAHENKKAEAEAKYQKQGYVSEDIADALGLPVGTMTDWYKQQQTQNNTQVNEANAWKAFQQLGVANEEIAKILAAYGVTPGMTTTAYYNAHKTKSSGSNSGSSGNYGLNW